MDNKYKHITQIENFFNMLLTQAGISDHVFVGELPPAMEAKWKTMVVAEVNTTRDKDAYCTGSVNVFLFARPTGTKKVKDIKTLYEMEEKLSDAVANSSHKHYSIYPQWGDSGYDDTRQLHYVIKNIGINIL